MFLGGSVVKNLPANTGDTGSIPGSEDHPLEKEMATPFSILAWRNSPTEVPSGLQFMGSQSDLATKQHHSAINRMKYR